MYIKAHVSIPQDRIFSKLSTKQRNFIFLGQGCGSGESSLNDTPGTAGVVGSYALIPFCHKENFSESTEHKINTWPSGKTREWETVNNLSVYRVKMQHGI